MLDPKRFTLSVLPLPAKLVVTVFLLSVGLGFVSGMVQLHMKETKHDGSPLPGVDDVREKYCGYVDFKGLYAMSKMESLITGDPYGVFSKANMTPAFFGKSEGYAKDVKKRKQAVVDAERETEREALVAWLKLEMEVKKDVYDADAFELPANLKGKPIAEEYLDGGKAKVKTIITDRCVRCHDGQQQTPSMQNWNDLSPLVETPKQEVYTFAGQNYIKNDKQVSLEGLTQSTHAHLFGFSMLYALTGIILAFTKYPTIVKVIFCPLALLGQTTDICCWWLARTEPPFGPTFAAVILGTGGIAAMSLAVQIFLSLFDMYGTKGKVVVFLLLVAGLGGGGFTIYTKAIKPGLDAEKARAEQAPKK
jgi:hypothetical protein